MRAITSLRSPARSRSGPASQPPLSIAELAARSDVGVPDTGRPPWPGRFHQVGEADIFVRVTPARQPQNVELAAGTEPALYLHGLGGASTNFTDVAELLSPWLAGEALDLPGFGRSGPAPSGRYSISAHAALVADYLRQSARGPVHLVGNSMGGAISIEVAVRHPELVRTLTLISPAVADLRPKRRADLLLPIMLLPVVGSRMMRKLDSTDPRVRAAALIDICFAHPELIPPNRRAEAEADVLARRDLPWANAAFLASMRGIAGNYLSYGRRSVWRVLADIQAPTLVIWGELDRLVDVSRAPRVAASIADATLLVLPDVGHTAQLEDPQITARAILSLVRRANQAVPASDMPF